MVKKVITQGLPYEWPYSYELRTGTTGGKLILRGPAVLDVAGILFGNRLTFSLTAADTAQLTPGLYFYEARRTSPTSEETIERLRVNVIANLETVAPGYDGLSQNQKNLAAIQATLAARAAGGTPVRYRIGNRELYSESLTDLMALERYYQRLVDTEMAAENGVNLYGRKIRYSLK